MSGGGKGMWLVGACAALATASGCGRFGFDAPGAADDGDDGDDASAADAGADADSTSGDADLIGPFVTTPLALPTGGDVRSIAVSNANPNVIQAVIGFRLFRSNDRGQSWIDCHHYGEGVVLDPGSADIVTVSGGGTYQSTDGCQTWTRKSYDGSSVLAVHGSDILVGVGGIRRVRGGVTTLLSSALDNLGVSSVAVATNGTIIASGWEGNIVRSTNDGASFTTIATPSPGPSVSNVRFVDPADDRKLVANCDDGAYLSVNAGATWTHSVGGDGGRGALAIDPGDRTFILSAAWFGMIRSVTAGSTFDPANVVGASMNNAPIRDVTFTTDGAGAALAATGRGVFLAASHALAWTERMTGVRAWTIRDLTRVPGTPVLYAATPSGLLRSGDHGATWTVEASGMEDHFSELRSVSYPPGGPLLAGGGWLWQWDDSASHFGLEATVGRSDGYTVTSVRQLGSTIWFGTRGRVWRSDNAGATFSPFAIAAFTPWVNDLALASADDVWVATDSGVFHSTNGTSFARLAVASAFPVTSAIALAADGRVVAGTNAGLACGGPGATELVACGLAGLDVRDLLLDGSRWFAATTTGVFVSRDAGTTWEEVPGFADVQPRTMILDELGRLVVGTEGFGLFHIAVPN